MTLSIDIVSDVVCPWCYIGTARLERALAEAKADDVAVRFHPFFLDATTPPEGRDLRKWLEARYGRDPTPMFARVEAEAARGGLALDLSRQRMSYPTPRAHALLAVAGARGTQRALALALFQAYFDEAKNIADPEVLADIGLRHGFTRDEVLTIVADPSLLAETTATAHMAAQQGISGVPFFILGGPSGRFALSGAQPYEVFVDALKKLRAAPDAPTPDIH